MSETRPAGAGPESGVSAEADPRVSPRLGPLDIVILSLWCGLAAGLVEVGGRFVGKTFFSTNHLYMMSRHFFWLAPLSNLLTFAAMGVFLALLAAIRPRFGRWIAPRWIVFLAVLPVLIVAMPGVYAIAWVLLAWGTAIRLASEIERRAAGIRRRLIVTFPALIAVELGLAGWILGSDWMARREEVARPFPAGDPPSVILITMDTVRADHLSLYGYGRPTTPVLDALARSGIRFERARAAAPWTLPSHATMFTGLWQHEVGADWLTPLDRRATTLAEVLGSRGYATAGFVGNELYCSYDTGLSQGFTHYEDYPLVFLLPLRTAWLFDHALGMLTNLGLLLGRTFDVGPLRPLHDNWMVPYTLQQVRKDASLLNNGFLNWLNGRQQPGRPFFAFINYYDAHSPYVLPQRGAYRFGLKPRRAIDFIFLAEYWDSIDKMQVTPVFRDLARDSYDNCIAYIDQCLGELVRELQRRKALDHTWLIVTADHGEGLGDHALYDHGESLYDQEIRVPLLILPPVGQRKARVIGETVSLRDLAATILDLTGQSEGSRLPGHSLAALWRSEPASTDRGGSSVSAAIAELPAPNPFDPNRGRSPARRGPLVSVAEGDFVYIRNRKNGTEELYNDREDPGEIYDLSRDPVSRPILERLRSRVEALN